MTKKLPHGENYYCMRPRLYSYLIEKGFKPDYIQPHFKNPKYLVWVFKNSVELEAAIEEYFNN